MFALQPCRTFNKCQAHQQAVVHTCMWTLSRDQLLLQLTYQTPPGLITGTFK